MAGASSVGDGAPDAWGAADAESEKGADTHVPFGKVLTEALTKRPGMLSICGGTRLEMSYEVTAFPKPSHLYDSTMQRRRIPVPRADGPTAAQPCLAWIIAGRGFDQAAVHRFAYTGHALDRPV